uniref:Uncharacterized protein n=1 Tax=Anguilla anguilla TaxID=7936 RepID=A0A0E9PVT5_ANGAN
MGYEACAGPNLFFSLKYHIAEFDEADFLQN